MKKILWLLAIFFMINPANAEENLTPQKLAEQQAKTIYENCEQKIPLVNENNVIIGNIADVERVRKIRNCIKDNILKQVQDYLRPDEVDNFAKNIEADENARFNLYKSLYFCSENSDEFECKNQYKNDTSLGKLMLEHRLKGDVYNLLIDVLEAKNGGFNF